MIILNITVKHRHAKLQCSEPTFRLPFFFTYSGLSDVFLFCLSKLSDYVTGHMMQMREFDWLLKFEILDSGHFSSENKQNLKMRA